jgi:serine/threonine protein kinase
MVNKKFPAEAGELSAGLAAGSQVAGYRLERQIGAGGMAVVFLARDERLQRQVALKILDPALAADEEFRNRFIRESRAAAAVDDPNIIPIFEAGEADRVLFIAMRYVPGGDVRTLVRTTGPLSAGRALAIISPVASALDAAHGAGLVHRDVKPANMLVDVRPGRPYHVYLSDFGLSKGVMTSLGPTISGQFLGTPGYSAPEQMEGKPVDGRADQYSLACAAFEILTGETPFPRDQVTAVIWAHMVEPPPTLTSRRPGLPPAVDRVLARALAKVPRDRYASCREFADALRETLGLAPYDSGVGLIPPTGHRSTGARPAPTHHEAPPTVPAHPDSVAMRVHAITETNSWYPGPGEVAAQAEGPTLGTRGGRSVAHGGRRRSRMGWRLAVVGLAAVIAVVGVVAGLVIARSPSSAPRTTGPPATVSYTFPAQLLKTGLLIERRWTLGSRQGSQLTETITARSATGKPIAAWFQDSIPAGVASTVQSVRFSPRSVRIVKKDLIVEWYLRVPAHGTVTVGYVATVPAAGASATRLAHWAMGLVTIEEHLNTPLARHSRSARPTTSPTSVTPAQSPPESQPTPSPGNPSPFPTYTCNPEEVTCSTQAPGSGGSGGF